MPIYIDNSILCSVATCDTRTVLRYILGYTTREERANLLSGTAGHDANAEYFRTAGDKQAALDKFAEVYRDWADANVPPDDRLTYENTHNIMNAWYDAHPLDKADFTVDPAQVEIGFSFPLDSEGEYVFVGRIDAIVTDNATSRARVLDHKFPGRIDAKFARNFKTDTQFTGYIWAASQTLGIPVDGGYVNGIEFSRLPSDPSRKCAKHGTTYDECGFLHLNSQLLIVNRTPQQIARWRVNALALAKRFAELKRKYNLPDYLPAVPMQGTFIYATCAFCEAHDFCITGKPVAQIDSLFQISPWEPFEHAFGKEDDAQ